jgi:drug/metabolite transporter (DMT)-like permease
MVAVIVGLLGALVYGSADFVGGIASKRISPIRVTAIGGVSGLVVLLLAYLAIGGVWSTKAVLLGALSGVSGSLAIVLLYACLAIGPMSILSPVTAVVSAIVPMLAGVFRGERLQTIGYVALLLALVAVVLVGFVPEKGALRPSLRALGMAVVSGALIGVFLIIVDLTPDNSGLVPLIANRAVSSVIMFTMVGVLILVGRKRAPDAAGSPIRFLSRGWRAGLWLAALGGAIDASANAILLFGLRLGELTIQSVLTALYPAGTIILAAVLLRERIAPVQIAGLVLALVAAALLALA